MKSISRVTPSSPDHTPLAASELFSASLPNGLRLRVSPMSHVRSVSLALCFATGSRYEDASEQGIAHLVEHMLFKGSARYPTAQSISEAIEGVGGVLNASTDKEMTVYWSKVGSQHLDLAFDLLADMVTTSRLDDDELEKEKKVVLEELGLAQDSPGEWVHQLLTELLWPDQPLGREIAGTPTTVHAQTPGSIAGYIRRTHGMSNAVLSIAGNADPQYIHALVSGRFGANVSEVPRWTPALERVSSPRLVVENRPTEQTYLALGGHALPRNHPDRYALRLANAILGDGMSSRLFLEVRERLGLTYDISSYVASFHDSGALVVAAGVDPDRTDDAIRAILQEIDALRQARVSDGELRKAKEYIKGRTWLGLEDSFNVANWNGSQATLGVEELTPDESLDRLDSITSEDLLRTVQAVFTDEWINLACIGPNPDNNHLESLLRF